MRFPISFLSISLPAFSLKTVQNVLPDAFTIAILAAIESLLSCVVADSMVNSRHRSNMELIAQGAGNITSALFGGIPATGAIARTAANVKNGGRTPHCRYGAFRDTFVDPGSTDALCGTDPHAHHCSHSVHGGLQYVRLA